MTSDVDLFSGLVKTEALRIAPPGEVFWYTSGTVGPYYINTERLFGGPHAAQALLTFIDEEAGKVDFATRLWKRIDRQLQANVLFSAVIEALAQRARECLGGEAIDAVSGGERRDWFFSLGVAARLGKPHLFISKSGRCARDDGAGMITLDNLSGQRFLHVADLVTEASSYTQDWIPALRSRGGEMAVSVNVIDRAQGGIQAIADAGVAAEALMRVDEEMFAELQQRGLIDAEQRQGLIAYFRDPQAAMKQFLQDKPEFLRDALGSADERVSGRARKLMDGDLYGLSAACDIPPPDRWRI
ncbi:MAG: hypothetical protein VX733_14675 [Candidatus Latescibacterota bacterium]|nr:hypothetical protein [Candidatus Latescibacterota bacterium]